MSTPSIKPSESRLFKPLKVSNFNLNHRIVLAPLTRFRNDDAHAPLPFMAKYYSDRASYPGTLVISEATSIAYREEGQANIPGFTSDDQVKAWAKIIEAVHAKGSYFFQQIWALGRAAEPELMKERGFKYWSSSATPLEGKGATPAEMTEEEIQATIQDFVAAAKRAIAAGADGVEIHGAHGYLLEQFLSDGINHRNDKWGGSVENRSRLLLTVVKAVVDAIGAERVAIRLSPWASFQGSATSDVVGQFTFIVNKLKQMNAPFAYLSLVEATGDPGAIIFGGKDESANKTLDFILEAWNNHSPVIVAGGYRPDSAAWALEKHYAKWNVLVAFGRHFLANPDLVWRIRNGQELNKYNRPTFYINKSEEGYNDYPFSEEWLKLENAKSPKTIELGDVNAAVAVTA